MVTKQGCTVYPVIVPTRRSLKSFNFYLLEKGRSLILVDGGMATNESWQALRTTLAANGFAIDDLSGIIITHHHHDHVGVVNNILEQKDVPIYAIETSLPLKTGQAIFGSAHRFFQSTLYGKWAVERRVNGR